MLGSALLQVVQAAFLFTSASTAATIYPRLYGSQSNYTWPNEIADQAHDPSWSQFVNKTTRWSTYEPPSFNEVFLPETEEDLSIGVSCVLTFGALKGFRLTR